MKQDSAEPHQLHRVLGPWMATAIVIGTVIGSGVFKKAQPISQGIPQVGLALCAWVLVGFLTLMGALALAEVAIVHPKAGGNYVFLRESYGRMFGFLWGWVELWFIRAASVAALAWIFAESCSDVIDALFRVSPEPVVGILGKYAITIGVIVLLGALNARGTLLGGRIQVIITAVKVFSLVGIAVIPLILFLIGYQGEGAPKLDRLYPLFPESFSWTQLSGFGAAMVGILWAYDGWMNIAPIAGEVTNPSRNLPRAAVAGVLTLIALYVTVNLAYYLTIPVMDIVNLPKDRMTAGEYAMRIFGSVGLMLASICLMISVLGALNGNQLVGPRLLFAMGQDELVPGILCRIHPRYNTPANAGVTLSVISIVIVLAGSYIKPNGKALFDVITDFSMFGAISFGCLAVGSIFVVRKRFPVATHPLPYRCPGYPLPPVLYIVFMIGVIANMFVTQQNEAVAGVILIAVGGLIYFAIFRNKPVAVQRPA